MTSRSPRTSQSRSSMFTISLFLGLLLIPLSAVAATALMANGGATGTDGDEASLAVVDVPETTVTTTESATSETVFVTEPPTATRADLETACGAEGLELVEREAAATITDLEQAALDSLRQICAEEGLEIAGPPAPPPVVRTVSVVDSSAGATTADTVSDDGAVSDADTVSNDDDRYEDDDDRMKTTTIGMKTITTKRTRGMKRAATDAVVPHLHGRGGYRRRDRFGAVALVDGIRSCRAAAPGPGS